MSKLRLTLLTLTLAALPLLAFARDSITVSWKTLGDDLQIASLYLPGGLFFSTEMTLIKTSLTRYRVGVARPAGAIDNRDSVREISKATGGVVCINANFFDEDGKPLGVVISKGRVIKNLHRGGKTLTGVFAVKNDVPQILHRDAFSTEGVSDAAQSGPRLIKDGIPITGIKSKNTSTKRSGVCISKQNELILFIASSTFGGASVSELQKILVHPSIQCRDALNLDGGGSTQLYISDGIPGALEQDTEQFASGSDDVPSAICLYRR